MQRMSGLVSVIPVSMVTAPAGPATGAILAKVLIGGGNVYRKLRHNAAEGKRRIAPGSNRFTPVAAFAPLGAAPICWGEVRGWTTTQTGLVTAASFRT